MTKPVVSVDAYFDGLKAGDRRVLARAITLIESTRVDHRRIADQLIDSILPLTGSAARVGISGPPGVGKSTLIETLGVRLCDAGHRVAVLAIDPSSTVRGGSILGDKTRMFALSQRLEAFVRPSPSSGELGGVHAHTLESILLCEAAGFDVILIETVGVGQSETTVAQMVDTLVVLLPSNAGDELQGIKKGVLEVADVLAINKADGANLQAARRARKELNLALHLVAQRSAHWNPPVLLCSATEGAGVDELWAAVCKHRETMTAQGELQKRRASQRERAMWQAFERGVLRHIQQQPAVQELAATLQTDVYLQKTSPFTAARQLVELALSPELRPFRGQTPDDPTDKP